MELRQIKYFIAVANQLSFSKAAETLYISQSTLSQQIRELENEVGVELLWRDRHSVRLTAAGKRFLEGATHLIVDSGRLIDAAREVNSMEQRRLIAFGIEDALFEEEQQRKRLLGVLRRLRSEFDSLEFSFQTIPPDDCERAVERGMVDISLHHAPFQLGTREIGCIVLSDDRLFLGTNLSPDEPLEEKLRFLEETALFLPREVGSPHTSIMRILKALHVHPEVRYLDNVQEALLYAELGYGGLLIPEIFLTRFGRGWLHFDEIQQCNERVSLVAQWRRDSNNEALHRLVDMFRIDGGKEYDTPAANTKPFVID
jgi:DNA-binding transcriptional LysR family regulator